MGVRATKGWCTARTCLIMLPVLCPPLPFMHAIQLLGLPQTFPPHTRRHEVQVVPLSDPVTGNAALLLLQTDITGRAELETRMAALTQSQLSMLEQMFPR